MLPTLASPRTRIAPPEDSRPFLIVSDSANVAIGCVTLPPDFLNDDERTVPIVAVSERLSVLPAGTSRNNPIAGLVSERMRQLLEYAKEEFDWVLLDTPPVALLSDANLLGRLTDAVVFVVAAGSTPYPVAQRALATLGPERILGVVLNKAPAASIPDSTYYERYSPQDGA